MRARNVVLSIAIALAVTASSSNGESRPRRGTGALNPITIESQIREIRHHSTDNCGDDVACDYVIIRLYRQPYDVVAVKWLPVENIDGCRMMYACDLQERDNVHLDGDLDHATIYANKIVLLRREQHVGR